MPCHAMHAFASKKYKNDLGQLSQVLLYGYSRRFAVQVLAAVVPPLLWAFPCNRPAIGQ